MHLFCIETSYANEDLREKLKIHHFPAKISSRCEILTID